MVAYFLGLGAVHKVLLEPADHHIQIFMESLFFTVIINQVFNHIAGEFIHAGIDGMSLVDYFAAEYFFKLDDHAPPFLRVRLACFCPACSRDRDRTQTR
jgi:hypothetical protein